MEQQQGDVPTEAARLLERALARMERIEHMERAYGGGCAMQTTTINGSGRDFALWIAATCCVVMLAVTGIILALYLDQAGQMRRLQDYWTVTVQYVPGLKDQLDHKGSKAP